MRTLNDNKGYFKMHWEVFDMLENPTVALLLEYLIEVAPTKRERRTFDGEEYVRMSNAFIQDRLNLSDSTIKRYLDILEKEGFIKIHTIKTTSNKARYIKVNTEVISEYDSEYGSEYKSEYGSKRTNKENKNKRTKETKRNDTLNKEFGNTNVPLLEDVLNYYNNHPDKELVTKDKFLEFYNSCILRNWTKSNGAPIIDWKGYFNWFITKDKPKETARDRDPGKATEEMLKEWLK